MENLFDGILKKDASSDYAAYFRDKRIDPGSATTVKPFHKTKQGVEHLYIVVKAF